jgi:RNA-directed DNA polymerase
MPPVLSVRDLAHRLGTSVQRLREIALELDRGMQSHYTFWSKMNQKNGKVRHFRTPKLELMQLQSRIKVAILDPIGVSDCAHGAVRGRSPHTNASQHLGQPCVVTIDVRGFFPNVRHYMVYRLFRHELRFGTEVASLLTRLTTLHAQLPQGAPSSPGIANILMASAIDGPVSLRVREVGATNTRFLDDFAFSGSDPASLINDAARALSRRRLPVWRRTTKLQGKPKLKIMWGNQPQQVTGLNVNARAGPSSARLSRRSANSDSSAVGCACCGTCTRDKIHSRADLVCRADKSWCCSTFTTLPQGANGSPVRTSQRRSRCAHMTGNHR